MKCFFSPGLNIRVIDPFTIKPLDASTIVASARATGGRVITVEDHYKEGELLLCSEIPSRLKKTSFFPFLLPSFFRFFLLCCKRSFMLVPLISL